MYSAVPPPLGQRVVRDNCCTLAVVVIFRTLVWCTASLATKPKMNVFPSAVCIWNALLLAIRRLVCLARGVPALYLAVSSALLQSLSNISMTLL